MLLVPRVMYGTYKDVKKASTGVAKKLIKGASVEEAYTEQGFVNVEEVRKPIVVKSHPGDGTEAVFPGMALRAYEDKIYKTNEDFSAIPEILRSIIDQLILTDWGTLTATTNEAYLIIGSNFVEKHKKDGKLAPASFRELDPIIFKYLKAAAYHWDTFEEIGPQYFTASNAAYLWELPGTTLSYLLANFGVPREVFHASYPEGGLWSVYPKWVKERIEAATV